MKKIRIKQIHVSRLYDSINGIDFEQIVRDNFPGIMPDAYKPEEIDPLDAEKRIKEDKTNDRVVYFIISKQGEIIATVRSGIATFHAKEGLTQGRSFVSTILNEYFGRIGKVYRIDRSVFNQIEESNKEHTQEEPNTEVEDNDNELYELENEEITDERATIDEDKMVEGSELQGEIIKVIEPIEENVTHETKELIEHVAEKSIEPQESQPVSIEEEIQLKKTSLAEKIFSIITRIEDKLDIVLSEGKEKESFILRKLLEAAESLPNPYMIEGKYLSEIEEKIDKFEKEHCNEI